MKNQYLEKHLQLVKQIEGRRVNLKERLKIVHEVYMNLNRNYYSIFYQHYIDTIPLINFKSLTIKKCLELIPFLNFYIEYSDKGSFQEEAKNTKELLIEYDRKSKLQHMEETIALLEMKCNRDVSLQIMEFL